MSVQASSNGALSQKKLDGIYWKTFVGFVRGNGERNIDNADQSKLQRREGSFEYMELTARDNGSLQSESESSCSSSDHSLSDPAVKDEKAPPMYAILDMNSRKEIPINDEIAVFDGSPIKSTACLRPFTLTFTTLPASPKCSPILHLDVPREFLTPSPIQGSSQRRVQGSAGKDTPFSDKDEVPYEEDSFDRLESTSPSMEPAPWKDHSLSIQRWMVPHILPDNEDEFIALPNAVPITDFEYCHYVPTLEAIMEESEEWADSRDETSRCRLSKSVSHSDIADSLERDEDLGVVRWNSANDLASCSQSQDDLFSITSTYGSIGSLRKVGTFENLSFDAENSEEESEGSSDEFDRIDLDCDPTTGGKVDLTNQEIINELSTDISSTEEGTEDAVDITGFTEPPSATEFLTVPNAPSDISSELSSPDKLESSREVIPTSSTQSLLEDSELQSSGRGSPTPASSTENLDDKVTEALPSSAAKIRKDSDVIRRDSGVDDVTSEPPDESGSTSSKKDLNVQDPSTELIIPGLPDELYIDKEDIPKIVVMFAQEELEKERLAKNARLRDDSGADDEELVQYRKRSATYDPESFQELNYSPRDAVPRRIKQIKANDASRLSTLSSSTPELSAMPDDALLYIPVSYATEAAAKKKKKRRATMSVTEGSSRARGAALQTKALISGTGLGNGFSSLRKKLKSRRSTGGSLRRSNSEKPNLSHSSPDVSSPLARFLSSPRHRTDKKPPRQDSPPKVEGRRRGIRSVVSNIFRRLGSRFTFQNRPTDDVTTNNVIEQHSPAISSGLGVVKEESSTGESMSVYSSARESVISPATADKCVGFSPRRVSCVVLGASAMEKIEDFRQRSSSVPARPLSKTPSSKYASVESDVFESMHSAEDGNSLDRTIYV